MTRLNWFLCGMTGWLLVFMVWDMIMRRIPHGLTALAAISGAVFIWHTEATLPRLMMMSIGIAMGFGGAWLVGLPGGDRMVMAWVGMMLGPWHSVIISLTCYLILLILTWTWGQRHSMLGVPFVPIIAIVTLIIMSLWTPPI